jgi:hypothetical protein
VNYSEVQAAVLNYVHRDDPGTVGNIPTAIAFGQSWIAQNFAPQDANVIGSLVFVAGSAGPWAQAPLPALFGRFVTISQPSLGALNYVDPRTFVDLVAGGAFSGVYTIAGGLVLAHGSVVGVTCLANWVQQPDAFTGDTSTNYLSTGFADLLVWAAVAEQHRFIQDWEEGANAQGYAQALMQNYNAAHIAKQQSGGKLVMKG